MAQKRNPNQKIELARISELVGISIVVPTYKECENIPHLIKRIDKLRQTHGIEIELLFMDDNSKDGSVEAVAKFGADMAHIIERTGEKGLSPAVIDGFKRAKHPILICMDCDLSHPPEVIPQMILALASGAEFVIGSRYVKGGSTNDDWGFFRWLNSRIATILAFPLTAVRDPMSGFFALRKADFETAQNLNPVGYKIGLELIVKCGFKNIVELPIHFQDRIYGESKLTFKEQLKYLKHIRRLYIFRFENAMYFLQFMAVGTLGVFVNLTILSIFLLLGASNAVALASGIMTSVVTNFLLNRHFTFSYARNNNAWKQFIGFVTTSIISIGVNYSVALYLATYVLPDKFLSVYIAALGGIAAGMIFNFIGNRFVVFRKRHFRDSS